MAEPKNDSSTYITSEVIAFIHRITARLKPYERDDAMSDGMEGAFLAYRRYDPDKGSSWGPHLNEAVRRAIIDGRRLRDGRSKTASKLSRIYVDHDQEPAFTRPKCVPMSEELLDRPTDRTPEDEVITSIERQNVRDAVAKLPPAAQAVAWASITEGGQRKLARELGVTDSAVCIQRRRVHDRLRALLRTSIQED